MESVDWSSHAREYYIEKKPEFKEPESISVRSFLIRTESRSALEALTVADELTTGDLTIDQFETVVREHTEDPNSVDGLIPNLTRGQTVREFEEAAFALTEIGQISEPVLSRYGAHVIQLINPNPVYRTFESVEEQIITQLKQSVLPSSVTSQEPSSQDPPEDVVAHQEVMMSSFKRLRRRRKQTGRSRHDEEALTTTLATCRSRSVWIKCSQRLHGETGTVFFGRVRWVLCRVRLG